ncbi:MAG TPA: hypothetical protein VI730_02880, partial [Burkholderiales bacterium]|nr:hypothetical protein [Burkholderiales bacterium]
MASPDFKAAHYRRKHRPRERSSHRNPASQLQPRSREETRERSFDSTGLTVRSVIDDMDALSFFRPVYSQWGKRSTRPK